MHEVSRPFVLMLTGNDRGLSLLVTTSLSLCLTATVWLLLARVLLCACGSTCWFAIVASSILPNPAIACLLL
jgi:hypothetical protein